MVENITKQRLIYLSKEFLTIFITAFAAIFLYYSAYVPVGIVSILYRKCAIYLVKKFHPDWIPLSIYSESFLLSRRNLNGLHCVSFSFQFENHYNHNTFKEKVERVVSSKDNALLKSYFTHWMGIHFLKPCPQFSLDSVLLVDSCTNAANLNKRIETFCTEPFKKYQPVWQILVIPNATATTFSITLRAHHGLFDGISVLRFLFKVFQEENQSSLQESLDELKKRYMPPLSWSDKLLIILECIFVTPFFMVYSALKASNSNIFTKTEISGKRLQHQHRFDVAQIQKIGHRLGHNGNIIFSGALIGAIREEMKARDYPLNEDMAIDYPLPSPTHFEKRLGNYGIGSFIRIPTSETDPKTRLEKLEALFKTIRRPAVMIHFKFAQFYYPLLTRMHPIFYRNGVFSNMSSFGVESNLKFEGKTAKNFSTHCGLQWPTLPFIIMSQKFSDHVILYVNTYESIFPERNGLQNFFKRVENELEKFSKM